jgi:BASS family bile acid:Na+ symporter
MFLKKKLSPILLCFMIFLNGGFLFAKETNGEKFYKKLTGIAAKPGGEQFFLNLNKTGREIDWSDAESLKFDGNLRLIKVKDIKKAPKLFLIRRLDGEIFILATPLDLHKMPDKTSYYFKLDSLLEHKLYFQINAKTADIDGKHYQFATLAAKPEQVLFDRIFKISIIIMLFAVMIGMGLTLRIKDFTVVLKKPHGIIIGEIVQFVIMPLVMFGIGHLFGFYKTYPYIFVGIILVSATPGGATSNLMTYYAKGDLALSISLTSFSTVLSLVFTPLILTIYCANVPDVDMPVKIIVFTILFLVIIPLMIGMLLLYKWPGFAKKATPFFSALGLIALLFIIIAGILSNLHAFADTDRYGFKFYTTVFFLVLVGMFVGAAVPKLFKISNFQCRAISIEIGIRNASLGMVIAILIQDYMGDFHSSMFVTSGIFGLWMYIVGLAAVQLYKKFLPVEKKLDEAGGNNN